MIAAAAAPLVSAGEAAAKRVERWWLQHFSPDAPQEEWNEVFAGDEFVLQERCACASAAQRLSAGPSCLLPLSLFL